MTTINISNEQLEAMKQISWFYFDARSAREDGYLPLDGHHGGALKISVGDEVVVQGRASQWSRGIVIGFCRNRIVVGTYDSTRMPALAVCVRPYHRDCVMLKTMSCARCSCYIHPAYDTPVVDEQDHMYCSDTCRHIASRQLVSAGA